MHTALKRRAVSWNELLFGPDLTGERFWESWVKARNTYPGS
jgi:hypothetical protein